jgi:hypothetical protein
MKDGKEIIKTIKEDDPPKKEKAEPKKLDKGEDANEEDEDE